MKDIQLLLIEDYCLDTFILIVPIMNFKLLFLINTIVNGDFQLHACIPFLFVCTIMASTVRVVHLNHA